MNAPMNDYLLLMHEDAADAGIANDGARWGAYLAGLWASGGFDGGSSIGPGAVFRQSGKPAPLSVALGGYLRVRAASVEDAQRFLAGNPVYEAGGSVEIRELPRD